MKTKKITKERKQEREFDVALADCKDEFGSTYDEYDVIDELAMCEIDEEE